MKTAKLKKFASMVANAERRERWRDFIGYMHTANLNVHSRVIRCKTEIIDDLDELFPSWDTEDDHVTYTIVRSDGYIGFVKDFGGIEIEDIDMSRQLIVIA